MIHMKEIKYLFDTNVIIDALSRRDSTNIHSRDLLRGVASGRIKGFLCSKQITDIYYVLRKYIPSNEDRKRIISVLLQSFEILPLLKNQLTYCLNLPFEDYEDAVIYEVAKINCIDKIITSNTKDFVVGKIMTLTPDECWEFENLVEPL